MVSLPSPFQNLHPDTQAYFLKFDSVHNKFKGSVKSKENTLIVEENQIHVSNETDLSKIKWIDFNVDFVIEATGIFTLKKDAEAHLKAGVIITAPSKECLFMVLT